MRTRLPSAIYTFASVFAAVACVVGEDDEILEEIESSAADEELDADDLDNVVTDRLDAALGGPEVTTIAAGLDPALQYDNVERALLTTLNSYRKENGRAALRVSITESQSAQEESHYMAKEPGAGLIREPEGPQIYLTGNTASELFEKIGPGPRTMLLDSTYKRVGIARSLAPDGTSYWTISLTSNKDAILSVGIPSIANNNKFEAADTGWPVSFNQVRTLGKWMLDGIEYGAERTQASSLGGSWGLNLIDAVPGASTTATQVVRARSGVRYRASVAVKPAGGVLVGTQYLRLQFLDKDFKQISSKVVNTRVATWHRITTGPVMSPSNTRFVRVVLGDVDKQSETGSFYYDNFRLEAF